MRAILLATLVYVLLIGAVAIGILLTQPAYPVRAGEPSGSIGQPIATTKPPAEPKLTMPPTDTD